MQAAADDESEGNSSEYEKEASASDARDSDDSSLDDDDLEGESYDNLANLPPHACDYCGIHNVNSVVKCSEKSCQKWFCNSKGNLKAGSHIIMHLVKSRHHEVSLHPESDNGETQIDCYFCGNKNLFILGTIPIKNQGMNESNADKREEIQVVFACRRFSCAQPQSIVEFQLKMEDWTSLIEEKAIVDWLVKVPSHREESRARKITIDEISKLESLRKSKPSASIIDLLNVVPEIKLKELPLSFKNGTMYRGMFMPLIEREALEDRQIKESQSHSNVSLKWEENIKKNMVGVFVFPSQEDFGANYFIGNSLTLSTTLSNGQTWSGNGSIVKVTNDDEVHLEMDCRNVPRDITKGYKIEFIWKSTTSQRLQAGLKCFSEVDESISSYLYEKILGQNNPRFTPSTGITPPKLLKVPNLPDLNISQIEAVRHALVTPLCLIQGPPGTGKTVTSATIIYHLVKAMDSLKGSKGQVLVCAPSNIVVDHLAERTNQTGLRVIRLCSKSREAIASSVEELTLQSQVRALSTGKYSRLQKYFALLDKTGELNHEDESKFKKLLHDAEQDLLMMADVICCTCVTAGDHRLKKLSFNHVLIDEATQAIEPECLLPLLHGAKHVILVGDHLQLGPVVISREVAKAGLNRSLFERLVRLGNKPTRLQVQYRMHPELAAFPSFSFYEGMLQNGISASDRFLESSSKFPWPNPRRPMFFWHMKGAEELSASGTSYLNRTEAAQVEKIVLYLVKTGAKPNQIGIITPYKGQRAQIIHHLQKYGSLAPSVYKDIEIASIDSFQGREKDFIILSCVRSSETSGIGFLADYRRLNVTITRSRYGLIIVGNAKVLSKDQIWNNMLIYYKEHGVLMEGTSLYSMQECSVELKRKNPKGLNGRYLMDDAKSVASGSIRNGISIFSNDQFHLKSVSRVDFDVS